MDKGNHRGLGDHAPCSASDSRPMATEWRSAKKGRMLLPHVLFAILLSTVALVSCGESNGELSPVALLNG